MRTYTTPILGLAIITVLAAFLYQIGNASAQALPQGDAPGLAVAAQHVPACPPNDHANGSAHCHARVVVDAKGKPINPFAPCCIIRTSYSPQQFRSAYNLNSYSGSPQQIIGIVDAFNDPNIQTDLDAYSTRFGIPSLPPCVGPIASSTVSCFQKVDQRGGTSYPSKIDGGWALETALDVEIAHAVCPDCSILLVEGDDNFIQNLSIGVNTAVTLGATEVSNSYGASEWSGESAYDANYHHPGVAVTVSTGDSGYGTSYPSASPFVTAIGGTTLLLNPDNSYKSESVWKGAGSGCSTYETTKPFGQPVISGCARRAIADVSAAADPNTGASVYSSVPYGNTVGWFTVGGTSLASPIIAGVYALAGGVPSGVEGNAIPYAQRQYGVNMHDVTGGTNGNCRSVNSILCTGVAGWDGPSGLGTPNGVGAF